MGNLVDVGIAELPEGDDSEGPEAEGARPSSQAVETVRKVHSICRPRDQQDRPESPKNLSQVKTRIVEPSEREFRMGRREFVHENREANPYRHQPQQLRPLVEAQAPLADHLDPVVEQANGSSAHNGDHHKDAGEGVDAMVEVTDHIAEARTTHYCQATHGRGTSLGDVTVRSIVTNRLTDSVATQQGN